MYCVNLFRCGILAVNRNRREYLIHEWAARLDRWGLTPVAPLLLRLLQPFGFVGSQMVLFGQPVLTMFADAQSLEDFSSLLDDPDALEEIERCLSDIDDHVP